MKKTITIILALILVAALGCTAAYFILNYQPYTLSSISRDPAAQLMRSFEKTKDAVAGGTVFSNTDTPAKALQNGSVKAELAADDGKLSCEFYLRDNQLALTGSSSFGEESANIGFWCSPEKLILDLPAVFGEDALGFDLTTWKEDLEKSALRDMMGESYDDFVELMESAMKAWQKNQQEDSADLLTLNKMKEDLRELLQSLPVNILETALNGVDAYYVAYTISPDHLCEAMHIAADACMSLSYVKEHENAEDMKKQVNDFLAEAEKSLKETNATTIVDFYLHSSSQTIMQAQWRTDMILDDQSASFCVTVNLGADPVNSTLYSAIIALNTPYEEETVTLEYRRSFAYNLPGRSLVIKTFEESTTLFDLQYNAVDNTYTLDLLDRQLKLTGACKKEDGKLAITLDLGDNSKLTLRFEENAQMPAAPAYKSIAKMSKQELEDLLNQLGINNQPDYQINPQIGFRKFF